MPKFNNLPQFFEELKIKEELTVEELIAQFKQQIPTNYLEIKAEEGNYMCSTNPKWKNKPLCERYGFNYQGKWIQLDIPHELLEKLGLKKGEDITNTFYLNPQLLEKEPSYGGITIENENEIILDSIPNKIVAKEKGTQTDLNNQGVEDLKNEIRNLKEELNGLRADKIKLESEKTTLQTKLDLETKTKEELLKYLEIYRLSSVMQLKEEDLDVILPQHTYHFFSYLNIVVSKSSEINFDYPNKSFLILEISTKHPSEDRGKKEKGYKTVLKMPSDLAKKFNIIETFGFGGSMLYEVVKYKNVSFLQNYNPHDYGKEGLVFYHSGNLRGSDGNTLEIKGV